ncbi:MAG: hydantoin racemase [Hyphomicrobiales bacterium]|mgnify:CR=1 FL=1|nr:MAG: hydantoin racemase [Hyphomicrobiales bacterium]
MMPVPRIALINPNTSVETTRIMTEIARGEVGDAADIFGHTASRGPDVITDEISLEEAAKHVAELGRQFLEQSYRGILISGFGDPGLRRLREEMPIPVTGIAEAGMAEASAAGRRFSIVTTTPLLERSIEETAFRYGYADLLVSVRITPGVAEETMANEDAMTDALWNACMDAVTEDGAEAILIGGGPLAKAGENIRSKIAVPLVNPVCAGARLALARL